MSPWKTILKSFSETTEQFERKHGWFTAKCHLFLNPRWQRPYFII